MFLIICLDFLTVWQSVWPIDMPSWLYIQFLMRNPNLQSKILKGCALMPPAPNFQPKKHKQQWQLSSLEQCLHPVCWSFTGCAQFNWGIEAWRHWGLALIGISLNCSCITGESEIAYLCCISSKHVYMEDSWLLGVVLVCLYWISLLHIFIA